MKLVLDPTSLLEASDYGGFLAALYKANKARSAQFSYAYIARKCHFSSKSFIKEVIDGKKRLSLESAQKIADGLGLPLQWKKYFFSLVMAESHDSRREIKRLREKLKHNDISAIDVEKKGKNLFQADSSWPYVFAALGTAEEGSTFEEIANRTRLGEQTVQKCIRLLVSEDLVVQKGRRYLAKSNTAFFESLGKSDFFKNFFLRSVSDLYNRAQKRFESQDALFFSMAVSINSNQMPELRKELAEVLDKYTAEIENPNGDRIAVLSCGFHLT